jgi:hypothetical protein
VKRSPWTLFVIVVFGMVAYELGSVLLDRQIGVVAGFAAVLVMYLATRPSRSEAQGKPAVVPVASPEAAPDASAEARSARESVAFTPAFFSMSRRQWLALGMTGVGCGVVAAALEFADYLGHSGPDPLGHGVIVLNVALMVLCAFTVGALFGAALSLLVVLIFHYATEKTRGIVRLTVILAPALYAASWMNWAFIPALKHAF